MVIGDRYSFAIDHEDFGMMYLFNGNLAMLIWKSGNMLIREIKYQSDELEDLTKYFSFIDNMPVRQTEIEDDSSCN